MINSWQKEISDFHKSLEDNSNLGADSHYLEDREIVKSIVADNMELCDNTDDFLKGFGKDLQSKFPNGGWRTINGAKVFVNGGKVVAGLGGFNKEIDKFFEEKKGKQRTSGGGEKKDESKKEGKIPQHMQNDLDQAKKMVDMYESKGDTKRLESAKKHLKETENQISKYKEQVGGGDITGKKEDFSKKELATQKYMAKKIIETGRKPWTYNELSDSAKKNVEKMVEDIKSKKEELKKKIESQPKIDYASKIKDTFSYLDNFSSYEKREIGDKILYMEPEKLKELKENQQRALDHMPYNSSSDSLIHQKRELRDKIGKIDKVLNAYNKSKEDENKKESKPVNERNAAEINSAKQKIADTMPKPINKMTWEEFKPYGIKMQKESSHSQPDSWYERQAKMEHDWAVKNNKSQYDTSKVEDKPKGESKEFIDKLNKLSEYEANGYQVTQLRAMKENLLADPVKAKLSFDKMDLAAKIWGKEAAENFTKNPLYSVQQFYHNDAKSVKEFGNKLVKDIKDKIVSDKAYVASLGKSKSDQKSKERWEKSIKSNEAEMERTKQIVDKL